MNFCNKITDSGIIELVKHLSRLKHLELRGCSKLTDASLTAIGQRCSNLKYLDTTNCSGMSLERSFSYAEVSVACAGRPDKGATLGWIPRHCSPLKITPPR
ncbi:F-box/LRR-repeat protein 2-like [Zootermopsis nevadensis]|uniref:F-box/LRR-repeat protein 2-like n=1 Tax=Zootermopsis nevadensis TaxID=136037 RepID=UPI000B8E5A22|nr:F-box/LRR-repeat protein 2-like [Zootermopsis nevadensis]XP_021932652.1 F-box/LRR-repeat protein 2-like [Zootermopsis nevadensis]